MPANRVQGVIGIRDRRDGVAAFDAHGPFLALALRSLLRLEGGVDRGHVEHGGIEDRGVAHQPLLGEPIAVVGRLDHQDHRGALAGDAPLRAARQQDVVAVAELEMAPIAEEIARALVHEQELVAVAVAHEVIHFAAGTPEPVAQMRVREKLVGLPRRGCGVV